MKKSPNKILITTAFLLCLALAGGLWSWRYATDHPKIRVASPFPQLEAAQKQKPFRLQSLTQLEYPSQTFEFSFSQGETRMRARTAYGPEGWAAYYRPLSLAPDLSPGRYAGHFFAESAFRDYTLLEPATPEQPVSSLTYRDQQQMVTVAAPYRYLLPDDLTQGWIAFSEALTPEQALALLEQEWSLEWEAPLD